MKLSAKQIQQRALGGGALQFLQSEVIAKQVADKAWKHLSANGYGGRKREQTVFVEEGPRWKGTWTVRLFLGITPNNDSDYELAMIQDAAAALRASYNPLRDLVKSYTC